MMMAMNAVTSIQCSQLKEINIVYTDNSLSVLVFLSGDQTRPGGRGWCWCAPTKISH